jgi:deoxycytidylate deaminase
MAEVTLRTVGEEASLRMAEEISDRQSSELVFALVGPVGSGVSEVGKYFREILEQEFAYDVCQTIKPSTFIRSEAHRVSVVIPSRDKRSDYISSMQTAGNELRAKFGANYLAEKTVEQIVKFRRFKGGYQDASATREIMLPGRRAYVIDSVKNGEEYTLLKQIYGKALCLVGIFAPDAIRNRRLIEGGVSVSDVQKITDRDQGEVATFGQKTRKVFEHADFFICNDQTKDVLRNNVRRFLHLMFDTEIHTPTKDEAAMYEASAVSVNSACMSRQVGAAIFSKRGELIAVGWNDVPKYGGSLYGENDQSVFDSSLEKMIDKDRRCFKSGGKICHNETRRNQILDLIADRISKSSLVADPSKRDEVRGQLEGTAIDSLTEFSRSIHAEMEAILSVAREGKNSLVGATLYTTTYPCHNCARHIVAAGITTVVYIEPYAKSLATQLHGDAITEEWDKKASHVLFRQYDGVAPRNFLELFRPAGTRKKAGRLFRESPQQALPVMRVPLDGFGEYEAKVIADLAQKEQDS